MQNLSKENMKNMSSHLYRSECALEGLAGLLREAQDFDVLEKDEMNGINEIVMLIRCEVLKVKQVIDNPKLISQLEGFSSKIGFVSLKTGEEKQKKN